MTDTVDAKTRSRMMAGIRAKDTRPEMAVRKGLFRYGYRYRLHVSGMPGKPDMIFPKYRAVVLVHGCFWHRHDCHLFKWPGSRKEFWKQKLIANKQRDRKNIQRLRKAGWRVLVIWECAVKGKKGNELDLVIRKASRWLRNGMPAMEIAGSRKRQSKKYLAG